jgi:GNAT superfamily N-acetyltransferase
LTITDGAHPRRTGTVWALNLDEPVPVVAPLIAAQFDEVGPERAAEVACAMGQAEPDPVVERLRSGRRCYAAWAEGQMAAYGWVSFEREGIGEHGLEVRLLPGEAYIWDCVTLPAYRRKRLYSALLSSLLGWLRAQGLCRAWIGADRENVASQEGMARAGFHPLADLAEAPLLGLRLVWLHPRPGVPPALLKEVRRAFLAGRRWVLFPARAGGLIRR